MEDRSVVTNFQKSKFAPYVSSDSICMENGSRLLTANTNRVPHTPGCAKFKHGKQSSNAARERSRVKTLRTAFLNLQLSLPAVPLDTKLSKLDILLLATSYISHLKSRLDSVSSNDRKIGPPRDTESHVTGGNTTEQCIKIVRKSLSISHPVKKWPMRARLYDGIKESVNPCVLSSAQLQRSPLKH